MTAKLISPKRISINGKEVEFPQRVKKFVETHGLTIVLLKVSDFETGDELVGRNILAYDPQGNLAWRVEDHGFTIRNREGVYVPQAYFGLWIDKDSNALCAGIPVADFEIDQSNGMLLKMEQSRW